MGINKKVRMGINKKNTIIKNGKYYISFTIIE